MAVRKASRSLPNAELALRAIAMPVFANAHGDIFGGWLLSQMDLAGSAVAVRRANGRVVTVAVTAMSFQRPVFVGDEDWALKAHRSDCDGDDSTIGASDGDGTASKIHLRQKPAAENISMCIGKHGHGNRP